MTPKTRLILFQHTKGTLLRRTTYFQPSNVTIGSGVCALQVLKNKVRKGKEGKEGKLEFGLASSHISRWEWILHTCLCMLRYDFSDFWCWYFKGRRFCEGLKFRVSNFLGVLALQRIYVQLEATSEGCITIGIETVSSSTSWLWWSIFARFARLLCLYSGDV